MLHLILETSQHQQKERALHTVFESAQALTELKELDSLLLNIVERGRKLLGSDLAWLAGSEADDPRFRVLAIDGASTESSKDMVVPPDAGIAGHVAKTRLPFTSAQYHTDTAFSHDATIDRILSREELKSVAAVPLLTHTDVIGILIVGNRYERAFHPWEVSILTILAAHASTAIRNARAYAAKQHALREVKDINIDLKEKIAALEFAAEADVRLATQLATGAGLQEMVEVIAALLRGYIVFLDPADQLLCASSPAAHSGIDTIVNWSDLLPKARVSLSQHLFAGHSIAIEMDQICCRIVAVLSGDDHLGSLLILRCSPLSDDEIQVFERCSTAMAVVALLTDRKSISARQDAQLTVRALLDKHQHGSSDLGTRAKRHGLDITAPACIVVLPVHRSQAASSLRKLVTIFRQYPHIVTDMDGHLIVIANRSDPVAIQQELTAALHQQEADNTQIGCVSRVVTGLDALANAYGSAKRSLALLQKLNRTKCIIYEPQISMYAALFQPHTASDVAATIDATIGRLLAHEKRRGAHLADTLLVFLDNGQNASATARQLGIHVNTMHKRLETISTIIGDWAADGRTVEIHIALRLWQLMRDFHPID